MEIILLEKVYNLGELGEKVKVRSGYARNYLLPQGKAVYANAVNLAKFEERRAQLEAKQAEQLKQAAERADAINKLALSRVERASDEGKLFGSLTARDVARLATEAGVELKKSEVFMPEGPIRQIGEYNLAVKLAHNVTAELKLVVEAE